MQQENFIDHLKVMEILKTDFANIVNNLVYV